MVSSRFWFFLVFLFFSSCSNSSSANELGKRPVTSFSEAQLSPTVYYLSLISLESKTCEKKDQKSFYTDTNQILATVCSSDYQRCLMQGSCLVYTSKVAISIGFKNRDRKNNREYWFAFDRSECPYGKGNRGSCIDPYFSVAADPDYWSDGDVIFVPALKNLILPSGREHGGFFVVRDIGSQIIGPHRFDFSIGYSSNYHTEDPFIKMKLHDKNTRLNYRLATAEEREDFLAQRRYPLMPASRK